MAKADSVMRGVRGPYTLLGLGMIVGGGLFALVVWYFTGYMPLVALGLSGVILGGVSLALGQSLPRISPDASLILLEAGIDNISALVEELGLRARAMYLPTSVTGGRARALIPMHGNHGPPVVQRQLEQRLIVHFGPGSDDYGVLVATPGSTALNLTDIPEDGSSGELESALSALLVGALDLVEAVQVSSTTEGFDVEVRRPAIPPRAHPVYSVLGSPVASIVATVVAESVNRPVSVISERPRGRWHVIVLEVQPEVRL